jgi:predicted nucleic acid-binding protein
MAAIADTGFLFALANTQDEHHRKVINVVRRLSEPVILPLTVLPEICYLLDTRLGHASMRQFVANVLTGAMELTSLNKADIARALKILQQYGDTRIDFVDATIIALAERLQITRILTVDQRHFRIVRPLHCSAFELLP